MRVDGRKIDEIRSTTISPNYSRYAEGSALISIGNTQVLCNATILDSIPDWKKNQGIPGGWITAEYSMLPRAGLIRSPRETSGLRGRTQEIRRLIGRSLRAAVDLVKLGERSIIIDCDVIQADGGTRTASITGGYIALAISIKKLFQAGLIPEDVLKRQVAAISVGVVNGRPLLDLNYDEDHQAEIDANIVMTDKGEFVELQISAEQGSFSHETTDELRSLAFKGIDELLSIQRKYLK